MWLSGGIYMAGQPTVVHAFHATSNDRVTWTINPTPVMSPGPPGSWDSLRVETPSVIVVGGTYHMYYSGCDGMTFGCGEPNQNGNWAMGHATSPDGFTWTRDANNPLLVAPNPPADRWGYPAVGEPGAFFNTSTGMFHLYCVGGKVEPTGFHGAILLATSADGSNFTWHADGNGEPIPVLQASGSYPLDQGWLGMTAPHVFQGQDGIIHLFFDAFAPGFRQASVGHAISADGFVFVESEAHISLARALATPAEPTLGDWRDTETWGANALEEPDGTISLWYAGKKNVPGVYYSQGIGLATGTRR